MVNTRLKLEIRTISMWQLHRLPSNVHQSRQVVDHTYPKALIVYRLHGVVHHMTVDVPSSDSCECIYVYWVQCICVQKWFVPNSYDIRNHFSLEIQENDEDWIEHATIVDSLAITIKNLKLGSQYRFRVRAKNIHGCSVPSVCSEVVAIDANNAQSSINKVATVSRSMSETIHDSEMTVRQGGDFRSRFILEEELGKGRFGVVHRVVERETDQILAAKIVKCIKAKDKLKVRRQEISNKSLVYRKNTYNRI